MKASLKIIIVLAVALLAIGAVALKQSGKNLESDLSRSEAAANLISDEQSPATAARIPKLVDLGAERCIPCKMMAPILDELKREYAGRMDVVFIDVWKNPNAGRQYGIEMIPTQIFYDAEGKELFRHVGFYGKDDILNKWKELGIALSGATASAQPVAVSQ
jgi:thioredoxin 1